MCNCVSKEISLFVILCWIKLASITWFWKISDWKMTLRKKEGTIVHAISRYRRLLVSMTFPYKMEIASYTCHKVSKYHSTETTNYIHRRNISLLTSCLNQIFSKFPYTYNQAHHLQVKLLSKLIGLLMFPLSYQLTFCYFIQYSCCCPNLR